MAYDLYLAERITELIKRHKVDFYTKEMMGGITWMVNKKMCINIFKGNLMVRVEPDNLPDFLEKPGTSQMMHAGKTMNGFLSVGSEGYDLDDDLAYWVAKCIEYNPKARTSKKKV